MKLGEVIIQIGSDLSIDGVRSKNIDSNISLLILAGTSGDYFCLFSQ